MARASSSCKTLLAREIDRHAWIRGLHYILFKSQASPHSSVEHFMYEKYFMGYMMQAPYDVPLHCYTIMSVIY